MLSDKQITDVIERLEQLEMYQAGDLAQMGMTTTIKLSIAALKQLTQVENESVILNGDDIDPMLIQSINGGDEFILTHLVSDGSGVTTCCGRTLFELPNPDRCTLTQFEVNCKGTAQ